MKTKKINGYDNGRKVKIIQIIQVTKARLSSFQVALLRSYYCNEDWLTPDGIKKLRSAFLIHSPMASLLFKRRQGYALRYLLIEMARQSTHQMSDFETIDGDLIPHAVAQAALRSGRAVVVGNLLVGMIASVTDSN